MKSGADYDGGRAAQRWSGLADRLLPCMVGMSHGSAKLHAIVGGGVFAQAVLTVFFGTRMFEVLWGATFAI